jgi:heat shock protein HslJ
MGGPARLSEGRLVAGPLATTEMACDPRLMSQDVWLADLLASRPTASLTGTALELAGDDVTIRFQDRRVAEPDLPLEGVRWTVEAIVSGEAVSSPGVASPGVLRFADGRVEVFAGCNRGSADYTRDGSALSLGPLSLTRKACPPAQMAHERAVAAVFNHSVTAQIEGDVLRVAAGSRGLVLRGVR